MPTHEEHPWERDERRRRGPQRPRMLPGPRWLLASVLFAALIVAGIVGIGKPGTNAGPSNLPPGHAPSLKSPASFDGEMLGEMNRLRREAGLSPLQLAPVLSRPAEKDSRAAARRGKLFNMAAKSLNRYASRRGGADEVQVGFLREGVPLPSPAEVVASMMKAKRKGRRGILSPIYNVVGIGVATQPTHLYATAVFSTGRR